MCSDQAENNIENCAMWIKYVILLHDCVGSTLLRLHNFPILKESHSVSVRCMIISDSLVDNDQHIGWFESASQGRRSWITYLTFHSEIGFTNFPPRCRHYDKSKMTILVDEYYEKNNLLRRTSRIYRRESD